MPETLTDIPDHKAARLVKFLQELANLRSKLVRDISEYERTVWLSSIPHEPGCHTQAWGPTEDLESDVWVEIQGRTEPPLPNPPKICEPWLSPETIRESSHVPELQPEISMEVANPAWQPDSDEPERIPERVRLDDKPEILEAWDQYVEEKWLPWSKQHQSWQHVHEIYKQLFTIHQDQVRLGEEYELVIGLGLLTWRTPNGQPVRRHLVVADASLNFETKLRKFTVVPATDGARVRPELDMLDITEKPAQAEDDARRVLAGSEENPWDRTCIDNVIKTLVHSLSAEGEYEDSIDAKGHKATEKPVTEFAPCLILRKRSSKGLSETLRKMLRLIELGGELTTEFADLAELSSDAESEDDAGDHDEQAAVKFEGEVYFPKPSNDAQRRIVELLQRSSGVLVQGPPGTGKSHTIANLICHLLATGQRILVTAKTPRALQVLNSHIPKELSPLCINLLGSGLEEKRSLETSVEGILREHDDWDQTRYSRMISSLEGELNEHRRELAETNRRLRDIREAETRTHRIADGSYSGTAARIAAAMNRDRSQHEWFVDQAEINQVCPLSSQVLLSALSSLRHFSSERRQDLDLERPQAPLAREEFAALVHAEAEATALKDRHLPGADVDVVEALMTRSQEAIYSILQAFSALRDARLEIDGLEAAWAKMAHAGVVGGDFAVWEERIKVSSAVIDSIADHVATADDTHVEYPPGTDLKTIIEDTRTVAEHLEGGGRLGWGPIRPKVIRERLYLLKATRIGGRACSTVGHFQVLAKTLFVRSQIEMGWKWWEGLVDQPSGPYSLQLTSLKSQRDLLQQILEIQDHIAACSELIQQVPSLPPPRWSDSSRIDQIIASCHVAIAQMRIGESAAHMQGELLNAQSILRSENPHPVVRKLAECIQSRDVEGYESCLTTIGELYKEQIQLEELNDEMARLRQFAPELVTSIESTPTESAWDRRLPQIEEAWQWQQARAWVEDYIRQDDLPALSSLVNRIETTIQEVIGRIASLRAWSFCFERLTEHHRRHMGLWRQSMKALGKGTGKHAPRHRRDAQRHLNQCREAVPAWVMPLHRVWDTVDPQPGIFDVIIVDEASQCGFESIPLFYLGKKILIVGDDKQISPEAVGLPRESVVQLMGSYLHDYEYSNSFDIERSLFDQGKFRYGTRQITLREHFRCMPEIIRFSNDLCYSHTPLIPLRQYGPDRLPPLKHVLVRDGYREGSNNRVINRPEAEAIVDQIAEICKDPVYKGKTLGVIIMQGEAQAELIQTQLISRIGADEYEARRLVCGNPYSFQGDERDVILLSLVAAPNQRIGPFTKDTDERRFNVAASRACDQMILFHSVESEELSHADLRHRLVSFFQDPTISTVAGIELDELERQALTANRTIAPAPIPFDSWFEVDVALELLRRNYLVMPQFEFAGKRIDLVIEGGQARLAVECDGDYWHGPDQYEADMHRQRQLERCGWTFFRVRESEFYANLTRTIDRLVQSLETLGIYPTSTQPLAVDPQGPGTAPTEALPTTSPEAETADIADPVPGDFTLTGATNQNPLFGETEAGEPSSKRLEDLSASEIQDTIIRVLSACPNNSCTLDSLTGRVLKDIEVITRGKPRKEFSGRVMQNLRVLEQQAKIERYKAKNERVRLCH